MRPRGHSMPRGLFFLTGGGDGKRERHFKRHDWRLKSPISRSRECRVRGRKKETLGFADTWAGSLPARKGWLSGPSAEPADGSGPGGATCRLLSQALKSPTMAPLSQTRRSRGFSPAPAPPLLKTALSERDDLSACPPAVDGECLSPFPFHGPFHGALPDPHRLRGSKISGFHAPLSAL